MPAARLFTTTTLLSLGGAYAVVPWALDESVACGWLEADERFTALAMGEATPGPLILVVTFIGFMAGWKATPVAALQAGFEGAAVATLFACLPSFTMIFGLAPVVRSIHPASWLGRAMTAVGAAVVAAIVLLAVKVATAALVSDGSIDPVAVVVALGGLATVVRTVRNLLGPNGMKTTIIDTYIVDHGRRGARRPAELFGQATRMRTTSRLMGGVSKGLNADPPRLRENL